MNRREMLKVSGAAVAGASVLGLSSIADAAEHSATGSIKKKALIIGAHPDDPETICGGTSILLSRAGYEVVNVYLTRGEAGIEGKSHNEAAAIRAVEAENACKITGARCVFLTQIDGSCEINKERYKEMKDVIEKENPNLVFTHWPIDYHRDHRICSILVFDAWRQLDHSFELFYCEAMSGLQSQLFIPTDYINIDSVADLKRKACDCHISQGMPDIYHWHEEMELFRGLENHCKRAEAFIRQRWNKNYIF